jgi:hypothetical protein
MIGYATERRMLPVLHLDPVIASAEPVRSLAALGHQAFESHATGGLEQIRPDLALLERRHEDALRPAAEELRQVCQRRQVFVTAASSFSTFWNKVLRFLLPS